MVKRRPLREEGSDRPADDAEGTTAQAGPEEETKRNTSEESDSEIKFGRR